MTSPENYLLFFIFTVQIFCTDFLEILHYINLLPCLYYTENSLLTLFCQVPDIVAAHVCWVLTNAPCRRLVFPHSSLDCKLTKDIDCVFLYKPNPRVL